MGDVTAISWCDHTHNHWIGCMEVSPACDGCYAREMMDTRYHRASWGGPGKGAGTRSLTSEANRRKPLAWNKKAAAAGTRPFVFCLSLADVFDNQVPAEWRRDLFELIRVTPHLVWLLLTKRPQLIGKLYGEAMLDPPDGGSGHPWPANAAIGTTVEDQQRAINLWHLANAARDLKPLFTFASFEPLLGPVDPTRIVIHEGPAEFYGNPELKRVVFTFNALMGSSSLGLPALGWAITGGETDQGKHRARPWHLEWARTLRDACSQHGTPFHHKQNGEWSAANSEVGSMLVMPWAHSEDGPQPDTGYPPPHWVRKVGRTRTGRLLDGVEHDARPIVPSFAELDFQQTAGLAF
jgi:protein gp37